MLSTYLDILLGNEPYHNFPDLPAAVGKYGFSYHTDFQWRSSNNAKELMNKFLQNGIRSK